MSLDRTHSSRLLVAILAAALALGCATTGADDDEETGIKQARSHFDIGVDHVNNGRIELGLREFLAATALAPRNAQYQHALGAAYVQKEKYTEAEQHLRTAIEIAPDYHDARFNLSVLLIGLGRWEEARVEADRLYQDPTFPGPWRALSNRAWAEYKLGRVEEARETFALTRKFNPVYWPALLNLGILESEQGRRPEAIQLYEAVLAQRPGPGAEAEVNYRLGEIYVSLGKRTRAVQYLTAAVVKTPSGRWGKKSEEALKLLR
ncbi:MAG TPA: tetratricopeptide repeat protein [Myxococcota bacterium]|jgi:tetratricopeptide (TPR) repeat protein